MTAKARSLATLTVVFVAAVAAGGSASAAGQTSHFSFTGRAAEAIWTSCPEPPAAGTMCTDTLVVGADQVTRQDGTKTVGPAVRLEEISYTVDAAGNFVFLAHRFGDAPTGFAIDALFNNASASATMPMTLCTPDGAGSLVCAEDGSATVSASWTGQGELARTSPRNDVAVSNCGVVIQHSQVSKVRDAVATADVDGDSPGVLLFADMIQLRDAAVSVKHRC